MPSENTHSDSLQADYSYNLISVSKTFLKTQFSKHEWKKLLEYFTCSPALTEMGDRKENMRSLEKRPAPLIS
jgi:hypothetical protein